MLLQNRNVKLLILIFVLLIILFGVGAIIIGSIFSHKSTKVDYSDVDVSTPVVVSVGIPDGDVSIENSTVDELFNYFREDKNCMYKYVNNINGSNSSKLMIAYNYIFEKNRTITSCDSLSKKNINNIYFCNNSTYVISGSTLDNTMNEIFGTGVGYIKEDFYFSDDSYIYYDSSSNDYIMYKYNSGFTCYNYDEELVSASSSNGVLEINSNLMLDNDVVRKITRTFTFDSSTGNYYFTNRLSEL